MKYDNLGNKMKELESASDFKLSTKIPVIGRIDGKSFHTLTKGMKTPWDDDFIECMKAAALAVASESTGSKLVYFQSDEISVLLTDYDNGKTEAWFNYETRKLCSIAAATATAAFCVEYSKRFPERWAELTAGNYSKLPRFDARFWNVPADNVFDYFKWRQVDAIRNSKQMLARSYFTHKELLGKSSEEVLAMVESNFGVKWSDLEPKYAIGTTIVNKKFGEIVSFIDKRTGKSTTKEVFRSKWIEDFPIFTAEYITNKINTKR